MSVTLAGIIFLVIAFSIGSLHFAWNMVIMVAFFGLLELTNVKIYGTTISGRFWEWSKKAKKWEVCLVAGSITALGFYLTLHLVYEV